VIAVADVSKRYGRDLAVDGVSFALEPGAITAVMGPNGSGKTTLLRLVCGLIRPNTGQVSIAGATLGYLIEEPAFYPSLSAHRNLWLLARAAGLPRQDVDNLLEQVGLARHRGLRYESMSLGMQKRLGIAAALLGSPSVLVLDEPTANLDVYAVEWLAQLLDSLCAKGTTVLIATQQIPALEGSLARVLVLSEGRLLRTLEPPWEKNKDSCVSVAFETEADRSRFAETLRKEGVEVRPQGARLEVVGWDARKVNQRAWEVGIVVVGLMEPEATLSEAVFNTLGSNES